MVILLHKMTPLSFKVNAKFNQLQSIIWLRFKTSDENVESFTSQASLYGSLLQTILMNAQCIFQFWNEVKKTHKHKMSMQLDNQTTQPTNTQHS